MIHMMKEGQELTANGMVIFGWDQQVICSSGYFYHGEKPKDAVAIVSSPGIAGIMRNFSLYMMHSGACLEQEPSMKVLENLIKGYEGAVALSN
jgi:hypothetical protein